MQPIERTFEKFLGGPTRPPQDVLYVSLNKQARIHFNANTYRKLGKPPAAYLYYSKAKDMIAVEPVHSYHNFPAAFPLKESHTSGWRIDAAPFCRHHNIRLDTTLRFIAPEIKDGRMYLNLGETVTVTNWERRKKKDR